MNMLDYAKKYGQFSFEEYPFNEIDAAIFSYLTYLNWELIDIDIETTLIPFYQFYPYFQTLLNVNKDPEQFLSLLLCMNDSIRYCNCMVGFFQSVFDPLLDEQFSAMVFVCEDNIYNICFRGTDTSIVGWKEDFNMLFCQETYGQKSSVKYVESLSFPSYSYRLIGHSKGGNFATFCASHLDSIQNCIEIYNFDGPGFLEKNLNTIQPIYHKFIPQGSIFGLILENSNHYTIIQSDAKHLHQHDLFNWNIQDDHFIRTSQLDSLSLFLQQSGNTWLQNASLEQRKIFIESFYELIQKENVEDIYDFQFVNLRNIIKQIKTIDAQTKAIINQLIRVLIQSNLQTLKEYKKKDD